MLVERVIVFDCLTKIDNLLMGKNSLEAVK